jgi:PhnB protein
MIDERAERLDRALQAMLDDGVAAGEFGEELKICAILRDLPRMERKPMMTAIVTKSVTPMILVEEPEKLLAFMKTAFGAAISGREARVGNAIVRVGRGAMQASLHYFVDDVDAAYERAVAAGATALMGTVGEPADRPYGERSAFVEDPFGNQWFLGKHLRPDGRPAGELAPHLNPSSGRGQIAFLEAAFGAKTLGIYEHEGKVMHAAVMVGNAIVEMGESDRFPMALAVAVDDPDAVRARCIAAGATESSDNAIVDPFGNHWYLERSL